MKSYFYSLLSRYLSIYIRPECSVVEIAPQHTLLLERLTVKSKAVFGNAVKNVPTLDLARQHIDIIDNLSTLQTKQTDFFLLNGNLHFERDIQGLLESLISHCTTKTRLVMLYYNNLWRPLINFATRLGIRHKTAESNWIAHEDIDIFCKLSGYEVINRSHHVLIPFKLPFLSTLFNKYLAHLPVFRWFTLLTIVTARPLLHSQIRKTQSVSVIVPVRNEAGNIEKIVKRIPVMGPDDEIIFVEGGSSDRSWETIERIAKRYSSEKNIKYVLQDGAGKGDAVRKGFDCASKEILMILDADISVAPEELKKFYKASIDNVGELIIGSRLVYPMQHGAMRFLNILGNKLFAISFSFVLGQRFKDTLCGTKVLTKSNYETIQNHRSFFGNFDPFGDFDLIFGAARAAMKICEIPVPYLERTYGTTNIHRWSQGYLLLRMLVFAAKKMKFI